MIQPDYASAGSDADRPVIVYTKQPLSFGRWFFCIILQYTMPAGRLTIWENREGVRYSVIQIEIGDLWGVQNGAACGEYRQSDSRENTFS
ncbi:hypothetical protein [Paenibacillus bovis]|uniref:hypothetical protein n=1 Tax=Paenibacillus bovis TaxID=1616788 RepID=UPI001314EEA0|nr:hypothetical protein [Paenibacillus bovis]